MEPQHSLPLRHIFVLLLTQTLQQHTSTPVLNIQGTSQPMLPLNRGQHRHIVLSTRIEVQNSLVAQTSCPNRKHIPLVVLLNRIIQDHLDVGSPKIVTVDRHLPARQEHPVDLRQQVQQLVLRVMVKNGDDLRPSHLDVFDVTCSYVSLILVVTLPEVLGVLRVHSYYRRLGR